MEARKPGVFIPVPACETSYPLELIRRILAVKAPAHLCDEIARDESPGYVQRSLRYALLSYVSPEELRGKTILDFGCGAGASTVVLGRMLPETQIVGVELDEKLLSVARLRARHHGLRNVSFFSSPGAVTLPPQVGEVDHAILSAVYEHLLPRERRTLLPRIWARIRPRGILLINQTPHRYSPFESHTTSLPLINYLPDGLALFVAKRFSKRVNPDSTWESLLRRGIRGGTVREITGILRETCAKPVLLKPGKLGSRDRIDLWFRLSSAARLPASKKALATVLKALSAATGVTLTPELSLAIQKSVPTP